MCIAPFDDENEVSSFIHLLATKAKLVPEIRVEYP